MPESRRHEPPANDANPEAEAVGDDIAADILAGGGQGGGQNDEPVEDGGDTVYNNAMVDMAKPPVSKEGTPNLKVLSELLGSTEHLGVVMMHKAMRANMRYKMARYKELREGMERAMEEEEQRLNKQQEYLKLKSGVAESD